MIRRKIIYLCVVGLLWLMKVLYAFRITAVLFYISLVIPVCLFVLLLWQGRCVRLELTSRNQIVEKRKPFLVQVKVTNSFILPIYRGEILLRYRNSSMTKWEKTRLFFYAEQGESQVQLQMESSYSASMEFVMVYARIYDMLGLFRYRKWKKKGSQERKVSVNILPVLHEMLDEPIRPNPSVMVDGEQYSDQKSGDDPAQVFDIREYTDGDKLNRIHWKMTVKKDELMVKEFGEPIDSSVLILLDLGTWSKKEQQVVLRDALLEVALSLSYRLLQEKQIHYLAWNTTGDRNIERQQIRAEEDFFLAAGQILRATTAAKEIATPSYYLAEYGKEQYTSIFYVSGSAKLDFEAAELLENRKSAWLHIISVGTGKYTLSEQYLIPGVFYAGVSVEQLATDICSMSLWEGGAVDEAK